MNKALSPQEISQTLDPIELEIIRQRLISIPNLIEKNIERTAFSLLVQEYKDYAVGLLNAEGELVSQSRYSLPAFVGNTLGLAVRAGLRVYGADQMQDGDVFMINEAGELGGHLNDVVMFSPIRHEGRLLGFFAVIVHWIDIGGATPGSCLSPVGTEIAQEGVQYPVMRLVRKGERLDDIFRLIVKNTRFPDMLMGDIEAQLGGCQMGLDLVREVIAQHGETAILHSMRTMREDARRMMQLAVSQVPPGRYTAECFFDDDGIEIDKPIHVKLTVIADGETITVDFSEISDQVAGSYNAGREGGAVAIARVALKFLFTSGSPVNEGEFDCLRIVIPQGKFLSAAPTAAHGSGPNTQATVLDTILRALHQALPDQIPAGHHGIFGSHSITGIDARNNERFLCLDAMSGGWGAFSDADGAGPLRSAVHGDVRDVPVEIQEALYPYRITRKALRPDSGGAGRFRGGLGIEKVYEFGQDLHIMNKIDRTKCPPWGLAGGHAGASPEGEVRRIDGSRSPLRKGQFDVAAGDVLILRSGGGGGNGAPELRDPAAIEADLRDGYITPEAAKASYGHAPSGAAQ